MGNRTARTPMVLLGLLTIEPMTGYELRQSVEQTVGHFWRESYGQIYPALRALRDDGLVEVLEDAGGPRGRKVYAITEAGRDALHDWLAEPPVPSVPRNELLLKLFFGRHGPPGALRSMLRQARDRALAEIGALGEVRAQLERQEADAPDLSWWLLTVDLGERVAQARLAWARDALDALRRNA